MALSESSLAFDHPRKPEQRVHCCNCIFFDRFENGKVNLGYCHIDPPIIIPQTGSKTGHWPIVEENNWCGEGVRLSREDIKK